jgi:hypothetical protein
MRLLPAIALAALVSLFHAAASRAAPCAGFTDVDDASPFCTSVAWLKNQGVTSGCSATAYCPEANVSRLQMAAFLARFGNALPRPAPMVPKANVVTVHSGGAALARAIVGSDGIPAVVRVDGTSLTFHKCVTADCTAVGTVTLSAEANSSVSQPVDAIVGTDGFPLVAYASAAGGLRATKCSDASCTGPTTTTTVDLVSPASMVSVALGVDGNPLVAYRNAAGAYPVLRCSTPSCSGVASASNVIGVPAGAPNTLALVMPPDGNALIAVSGPGMGTWIAKCALPACTGAVAMLAGAPEASTLVIDNSGMPVIVGLASNLLTVGHCPTRDCSSGTSFTTVPEIGAGAVSVTISSTGRLVVAVETGFVLCTTPSCEKHLPTPAPAGGMPSVITMPNDLPFVVFAGPTAFTTLRCGNLLCTDNWTRR